jgi:hypothetical protein
MDRTLLDNANIRKITVGDSKMGMTYQVKTKYGKVRITSIIRDENSFFLFGNIVYLIYAKDLETEEEGLWKYCENQPVTVELDIKNRQDGITPSTQTST